MDYSGLSPCGMADKAHRHFGMELT